jgi:hypothetical protein
VFFRRHFSGTSPTQYERRRADQATDLGRLSFRTAGQLPLLRERMAELSFEPDQYELADIGNLADALHGMAMRCAMSTGNPALLNELSGRDFRGLGGDDRAQLAMTRHRPRKRAPLGERSC